MRSWIATDATIVAGMVLIASTYDVFSATADETMHLSTKLELFTQQRFTYQLENPPLPRVVFAFVPWRAGFQFDPRLELTDQLKRVFRRGNEYSRNLTIAR